MCGIQNTTNCSFDILSVLVLLSTCRRVAILKILDLIFPCHTLAVEERGRQALRCSSSAPRLRLLIRSGETPATISILSESIYFRKERNPPPWAASFLEHVEFEKCWESSARKRLSSPLREKDFTVRTEQDRKDSPKPPF